jgi:hypothetical protein
VLLQIYIRRRWRPEKGVLKIGQRTIAPLVEDNKNKIVFYKRSFDFR